MNKLFSLALCSLTLCAALSACGGGEDASPMPSPARAVLEASKCDPQSLLQGEAHRVGGDCVRATPALRASVRPLAEGTGFTVDMLMNWAESAYPGYFAPGGQETQFKSPYLYRYYPATNTYLGVAESQVYVMGPLSRGAIAHVGSLADFSCEAAHIGCMAPGAPTLTRVRALDSSASVEFTAPASAGSSPITGYTATCAHGFTSISSASGPASPIVVPNLVNGQGYSCIVTAANQQGTSAPSAALGVTPAVPLSTQQTKIRLVSDYGDYIGGGRTYEYTRANAQLGISEGGGHLSVNVNGDTWWYGNFVLPTGTTKWVAGTTYTGLTRYPFNGGAGGLDWSGDGRGCNTLKATMTVNAATYDEEGVLNAIALSFVQYCEGGPNALRGQITWGADDPTTVPGPVTPVPATLWKPAAGAVPASGNYVYLQSDFGDYIGDGKNYTYTNFTVSGGGAQIAVGANSSTEWWTGNFAAMTGVTPVQAGYYGDLSRYPFRNPAKGGLEWSGTGRGCNTLSGWFAVDDIAYDGGSLVRLSLRFEQHCEGGGPALHGQVKWSRP
ncbi:fibronectin type III domain-containing protein [Caenimonas aquaedulcis]|uniref:Fibronectin type III domain-containing protein n=1 Tax=Caenimonas aquaedulcis TaxID=2793270 RepID=A0A931H8X8_9BURK|nr:fibronectin type III domain-containing protein [Caenimonas aquaedulcis]MBG9390567.1 fibronectin type III domain-containing protein [Caenimonas aquaedulcis]